MKINSRRRYGLALLALAAVVLTCSIAIWLLAKRSQPAPPTLPPITQAEAGGLEALCGSYYFRLAQNEQGSDAEQDALVALTFTHLSGRDGRKLMALGKSTRPFEGTEDCGKEASSDYFAEQIATVAAAEERSAENGK